MKGFELDLRGLADALLDGSQMTLILKIYAGILSSMTMDLLCYRLRRFCLTARKTDERILNFGFWIRHSARGTRMKGFEMDLRGFIKIAKQP